MKYFRYILALVFLCQSFSRFASAQLPDSIKIYDGSLAYMNINAYSYVLKKDKEKYTLYRTQTERSMHSSAWLEAQFYFPGNKIRQVKASMNQFGFPWYIDDRRSYNPELPKLFEDFLQSDEGSNKDRLAGVGNILKLLAGQVYRDVCIAAMHSKNLDDFNSR